jgi:NAD(P)-dependent dehydrogenase (short-subunit alcohol dehydrogenase family)/nitroreductase
MELDGKVALVTGAGSGIGRATAVALAEAGVAAVVVVDRDGAAAEATAALVEAAGAATQVAVTDVADQQQLAAAFAAAEQRFGGLDIVHNNAGLVGGSPSWPDTPTARSQALIDVNLGAVVHGTQLAVAALRRRGGGAIVNTSSTGGLNPYPFDAVYAATKSGVAMLTRCCRPLRKAGIRVNAVAPGVVDTAILGATGDDGAPADWLAAGLAAINVLTPEQVAAVVVGLVRDDERAGDVLVVDNPPEAGGDPVVTPAQFPTTGAPALQLNARPGREAWAPNDPGTDTGTSTGTSRAGGANPLGDMPLEEALYTTRAMRRLRPDPVPVEVLERVVEAATMGPTGSFTQGWRFYVVTDREVMAQLGGLWSRVYDRLREGASEALPESIFKSCEYMGEHFGETPAAVFVGAVGYPGPDASVVELATWFGSVMPAAQNLMLAARAHGIGSTFTTLILALDRKVKDLVGVPDDVTLACCLPLGYPKGRFGRPPRTPVDQVAFIDGAPLAIPAGSYGADGRA